MLINFSYAELMQLSTALNTIDTVYGNGVVMPLLMKINDAMQYMDNAPITDVYPDLKVVK